MKIAKIVSGGQTGADRGGWDAALYCQIPIGGWVPRGRKAEDGFTRGTKAHGIQQAVLVRMVDVISAVNGKVFYPLGEEG